MSVHSVKKFWNSSPCGTRHSANAPTSVKYFRDIRNNRYIVENHIPTFAKFEDWNGKNVLEVGCGIGIDSIVFALNGANVTAVDISENSINIAKTMADNMGVKINFICGDAEKLSKIVPKIKYDLIYSFGVIHHSTNPDKIMKQIRRVSSKDTEIRIMLYHKYSFKVIWILVRYARFNVFKLKNYVSKYSEGTTGCPITNVYSKKEVKELLSEFDIKELNVNFIFKYKISEYKKNPKNYVVVWYFRWLPKFIFNWLEKKMGWHLCIVCRGIKNGV